MSETFELGKGPEMTAEKAAAELEAERLARLIGDVSLIFKNLSPEDRKFFESVPEARRSASQNEGRNIIL